MIALLSDPDGQGGAGGGLRSDGADKRAHDTAELADVPSGEYDGLAVCSGTGTVHIAVLSSESPGRMLASADIACGATLRLPVTVGAPGVVLEASTSGTPALWQASIVTSGWQPRLTLYSK